VKPKSCQHSVIVSYLNHGRCTRILKSLAKTSKMEALNVEEGIALQAISQSPGSDTVSDTRTYPAETQNSSKKSVLHRLPNFKAIYKKNIETLVKLAKLGLPVWMIVDQAFDQVLDQVLDLLDFLGQREMAPRATWPLH